MSGLQIITLRFRKLRQEISENSCGINFLESSSVSNANQVTQVKTDRSSLKLNVASLEAFFNYLKQVSLQTTLVIRGLPIKPNENLPPSLESFAKALNAAFAKDELLSI